MKQNEKYLIFAHYHKDGLLRKDIVNFLNKSKDIFTKIIFVSTKIKNNELNKLPKNTKSIRRKNIGYDFYSYKIGFNHFLKISNKNFINKDLFFINSSILFVAPEKILKIVKKIKINDNEFYGISRSLELADHIQSYFFFFSSKLFENKKILKWWLNIKPINIHYKVILKYELGLSKLMKNNKIKLRSIYTKNINLKANNLLSKIIQRFHEIIYKTPKYYKKDPTNYFWEGFYNFYGLVKIRLIKDNNKKYNLDKLIKLLKKTNIYKLALNN